MAELEGAFVAFEDCPVGASVVVLEVAFAAFEDFPVVAFVVLEAVLEVAFVAFEDFLVVAFVVLEAVLEVAFAAFEAVPVVLPAGHLEEVDLALLGIEEVALVEAFAADLVVASAVLQVDFWVAFV